MFLIHVQHSRIRIKSGCNYFIAKFLLFQFDCRKQKESDVGSDIVAQFTCLTSPDMQVEQPKDSKRIQA